ncbi:MAG: hypothetical protein ACPGVP_19055 [Thiolinea sp.]
MAEARFDLVILHHTSDKTVENLVQELLIILDKVGDPYLEYKLSEALLFEQSSSAILDNISREEGERYQDSFRQLNVETELRPTLQLVSKEQPASEEDNEKYTCPACNYTQPKQASAEAMNICNRCGVVGEKLQKNQRKQEVYEAEKRKLEQTQNKNMHEATERARHDEEEKLRKEARERLGIKDKNRTANVLVGMGVVGAMGIASYFIADTLRNSSEETAASETIEVQDSGKDEKQPMITIQAGNGSIVINNGDNTASEENTGTGGSKGSTGEAITTDGNDTTKTSDSSVANQDGTNPINTGMESEQATAQIASIAAGKNNPALIPSQGNSSQDNSQKTNTNAQQLAALSTDQATINPLSAKAAAAIKKTTIQGQVITAPTELATLKSILSKDPEQNEYFFSKLDQEQFDQHKLRMERLLNLGKPELALIFVEGIEDPYPASLLLLDIAKYEADAESTKLHDDLLLSMKNLATQGKSKAQQAMLNATLSQIYDFAGDKESAKTTLEHSLKLLNSKEISLEQRGHLLTQIEQKHRDNGNQDGADFMAQTLINHVAGLSDKEFVYASRIYTHLAAASMKNNQTEDAIEWLNHVPVKDAQKYLLNQLKTLATKSEQKP